VFPEGIGVDVDEIPRWCQEEEEDGGGEDEFLFADQKKRGA
jgi:hypothetical protein